MSETTIDNGRSRVAMELLQLINGVESESGKTKDRSYYLKLMIECYKAAGGHNPGVMRISEDVLKTL